MLLGIVFVYAATQCAAESGRDLATCEPGACVPGAAAGRWPVPLPGHRFARHLGWAVPQRERHSPLRKFPSSPREAPSATPHPACLSSYARALSPSLRALRHSHNGGFDPKYNAQSRFSQRRVRPKVDSRESRQPHNGGFDPKYNAQSRFSQRRLSLIHI